MGDVVILRSRGSRDFSHKEKAILRAAISAWKDHLGHNSELEFDKADDGAGYCVVYRDEVHMAHIAKIDGCYIYDSLLYGLNDSTDLAELMGRVMPATVRQLYEEKLYDQDLQERPITLLLDANIQAG